MESGPVGLRYRWEACHQCKRPRTNEETGRDYSYTGGPNWTHFEFSPENNRQLGSRLQNRLIITGDNMGLEWR